MKKSRRGICEIFLPVRNYWESKDCQQLIFDIAFPFLLSIVVIVFCSIFNCTEYSVAKLGDVLINVLAILVGFCISAIAILASASKEKIEHLSSKERSGCKANGNIINYYQYLLLILSYTLMVTIGLILIIFLSKLIFIVFTTDFLYSFFLIIYVFLMLHIFALIVRGIATLYACMYIPKI